MDKTNSPGTLSPTESLQVAVRLSLDTDGPVRTMQRLALSRMAIMKIAAGQPVRRGTAALAALRLGLISELGPELVGEVVDE